MTDPLTDALRLFPRGDATFDAELAPDLAVGSHPHGGYLMALLARAAVAAVGPDADPLALSAQFLHAPRVGPATIATDVRKKGRTATVVAVGLEQGGRSVVEQVTTVGSLPPEPAAYADLPALPAEPPADAIALAEWGEGETRIAEISDLRLDRATAGFFFGRTDQPPRLRMWVRPPGGRPPDPYFAVVAGDISMPVTFNLGRIGWSPTVQLTALPRARPAAGWLRLEVEARAVHGNWFDADATVLDAAGRLVCQARQLPLTPEEGA
jgi:acyl-coenzyme A thioesterase PaaI-like protein